MAQRNQKDWRKLCAAVANETDSNKLGSLVQELIKALDEREQNWRSRIDPFRESRAAAWTNSAIRRDAHVRRWPQAHTSQQASLRVLKGDNLGFPNWEMT
jgi:hypothetical protein